MESGTQKLGKKKTKKCTRIVKKQIASAFCNGTLPHYIAIAFVSPKEAYLVNMKIEKAWPYIVNGKFNLKRAHDIVVEIRAKEHANDHGGHDFNEIVFTPESECGSIMDNLGELGEY